MKKINHDPDDLKSAEYNDERNAAEAARVNAEIGRIKRAYIKKAGIPPLKTDIPLKGIATEEGVI